MFVFVFNGIYRSLSHTLFYIFKNRVKEGILLFIDVNGNPLGIKFNLLPYTSCTLKA